MTAAVRALACPSCGGALAIRSGDLRADCGSCRTPCAIVDPEARLRAGPRVRIVPRVSPAVAVAAVRTALSSWPVDEQVNSRALFRRPELVYVPFCEVQSLQAGIVVRQGRTESVRGGSVDFSTGVRRFLDDDGREIAESDYYRRRERSSMEAQVVLRDVRTIVPVAGPEDWELHRIAVADLLDDAAVRIVPLDLTEVAAEATLLTPRLGPQEILASDARFQPDTDGTRIDHMAVRARWIYVPVFVVRWDLGRHPYTFVVHGVDGSILHGRAPETLRRGRLLALGAAVVIGFPLGNMIAILMEPAARGALRHLLRVLVDGVPAVVAVLLVVLSFLAMVWSEFRFRGEVVFGAGGASIRRIARPETTGIERLANRVAGWLDDWARRDR